MALKISTAAHNSALTLMGHQQWEAALHLCRFHLQSILEVLPWQCSLQHRLKTLTSASECCGALSLFEEVATAPPSPIHCRGNVPSNGVGLSPDMLFALLLLGMWGWDHDHHTGAPVRTAGHRSVRGLVGGLALRDGLIPSVPKFPSFVCRQQSGKSPERGSGRPCTWSVLSPVLTLSPCFSLFLTFSNSLTRCSLSAPYISSPQSALLLFLHLSSSSLLLSFSHCCSVFLPSTSPPSNVAPCCFETVFVCVECQVLRC